jgi:serine O-acetyltransferase
MTKLIIHSREEAGSDGTGGGRLAEIAGIVSELRTSREETHNIRPGGKIRRMPSRTVLATIMDQFVTILFPTHYGALDLEEDGVDQFVQSLLSHSLLALTGQVRLDLALADGHPGPDGETATAEEIVADFARQLPAIRAVLVLDLLATYEMDPAAQSYLEIMLGYPGFVAIVYHRLAHALYRLGATLCARLIANIAHSKTAIDIHPAATIGSGFFVDHGTGVVIGETAIVGRRVKLYQAVTLGAHSAPVDAQGVAIKGPPRHPIIEDDVVIHAGATILGRITVGRGSVIDGGVWLTQSVPAGSHVRQGELRGA